MLNLLGKQKRTRTGTLVFAAVSKSTAINAIGIRKWILGFRYA
jgi:hypothetical protein